MPSSVVIPIEVNLIDTTAELSSAFPDLQFR